MDDAPSRSRLTAGLRDALIAKARTSAPIAVAAAPPAMAAEPEAGFDTLPGLEAIRVQQDLARKLGISLPFYREHQARAGARTVIGGQACTNFTSYDYLALNGHPRVTQAVSEAAEQWGTSVSASRLTSGERPCHRALEGELSRLYGAQAALVFVSGHATNLAAIATLTGPKDLILHDALAHNSIVVGARLSGAARMAFAHNDMAALEALLSRHRGEYRHCLIVTEGHFSMDGDGPDLGQLVEIKRRHGAWLMVDEAHSLGVMGQRGLGIFEHCGIDPGAVDIWMGTLSKTLVSCGGYIAAPAPVIEMLKYHAPGMVYSVGLPATACVAAHTALDIMLAEPNRVARLQGNGARLKQAAQAAGLDTGSSWGLSVAPVVLGDSLRTVMLAERLLERGYATVPVFPPGVPEKMARLRLFVTSGHDEQQIDGLIAALAEELAGLRRQGLSVSAIAGKAMAARAMKGLDFGE